EQQACESEGEAQRCEAMVKPKWNLAAWFSDEQKALRSRASGAKAHAILQRRLIGAVRSKLAAWEKDLDQLGKQAASINAEDPDALRADMDRWQARDRTLSDALDDVSAKWQRVDQAIAPARSTLRDVEAELAIHHEQQ